MLYGVFIDNFVNLYVVYVVIVNLIIVNGWILYLLNNLFVIGFMIFIINDFGRSSKLDLIGVKLWMFCRYIGSNNIFLNNVIVMIVLIIKVKVNIGYLNICKLSILLFVVNFF